MAFSTPTAGSWHNEGFYGHNRSKTRNDVLSTYRQQAKPSPPRKFIGRACQPATAHVFSHHDNREKFLNDALYFEQGLGRRRFNEQKKFGKHLIVWHPHQRELSLAPPQVSSYREVYQTDQPYQQFYAHLKRPRTAQHKLGEKQNSSKRDFTTSYQFAHCTKGEFAEDYQKLNQASTKSALCNRHIARSQSARYIRETVATCLSWLPPSPPKEVRPQSSVQPRQPVSETQPRQTSTIPEAQSAAPQPTVKAETKQVSQVKHFNTPQATNISIIPAATPLSHPTAVRVAVAVI